MDTSRIAPDCYGLPFHGLRYHKAVALPLLNTVHIVLGIRMVEIDVGEAQDEELKSVLRGVMLYKRPAAFFVMELNE